MSETKELIVNHLPSLTWNRLGVNAARVVLEKHTGLAGSVSVKGEVEPSRLSADETAKWISAHAAGIKRELYPAGKYAIYQKQAFPTGLGAGFDAWVQESAGSASYLEIPAGSVCQTPVVITREMPDGGMDVRQTLIHVGEHAEATVIFSDSSEKGTSGTAALSTRVYLAEGAVLHLIKVNLLGEAYTQLDDTGVYAADGAYLDFLQMELGGVKTYAGLLVEQAGEKSVFHADTGYYANADHLLDMNYVTVQRGRKTESEINVKGVLADRAQKVFRGSIDFRNGSSGSVGKEREDVLLLDPEVVNKTTPVILCEEDDVDGQHGATIGRLGDDVLFYLGTRGISEKEAERIMTRGRLHGISRKIPDEEIRDRIEARLEEAFGE